MAHGDAGGLTGLTVMDLESNAPLGALGTDAVSHHPALLRFVPLRVARADPGGRSIVPVLSPDEIDEPPAGCASERLLAMDVPSLDALSQAARLDPDFLILSPEVSAGRRARDDGDAVLRAVLAYAAARSLDVIATGVTDQAHLDLLHDLGLRFVAGPFIDRRLRPGTSLSSQRTAQERGRWLRSHLDDAHTPERAAELVCTHVHAMGLLPSVYVERHGLMRCIAQRGYWQIMDGVPVDMGILGRTFRSGHLQVVDAADEPDFIEAVPGLIAEITVPLRIDDEVRAVLSVETSRRFAPAEQVEIERIGRELEQAIQRTGIRPEDTAIHRLARATAELATFTEREAVLHAAGRLACDVARTSSSMISVTDDLGVFRPGPALGPLRGSLRALTPGDLTTLASDLGGISSCISGGDAEGHVRPALEAIRRSGGACLGVFPVRSDRRTTGLLIVADHTPGEFDGDLRETMELLAGAVGRTLEHVALLEDLRARAELDGLTQVGSRAAFEQVVADIEAHRTAQTQLAVLFVDLDDFKDVNDRYGHPVGDDVLIATAQAIAGALRPSDTLYRIGGDEFAALVVGCGLPEASELADRIGRRAGPRLREVGAALTVGVAVLDDDESVDDCISRADQDLYARKGERRRHDSGAEPEG